MIDTQNICGYIIALYHNPQAEQYVELGGRVYASEADMEHDVGAVLDSARYQASSGFEFVILDEHGEETVSVYTTEAAVEEFFAVKANELIAEGEIRDKAYRRMTGFKDFKRA